MKLSLFAAAAAVAAVPALAQDVPDGASGAIVALSQGGLSFACDKIISPMLSNALGDLKIPDIDKTEDGVKVHIGNMKTHDFKCDDCVHASFVPGTGIHLAISGMEVTLHSRYTLHKIISTGGECETKMSDASLSGDVKIGLSSDGHPTLSISNTAASVGKFDLGCQGVSGSLLDALSDLFKDKVISAITDAATGALPPAIKQVSDNLQKVDLDIPITNNFAEIRFDFSAAPTVAASAVSVAALGTVVPTSDPGQVAPYAIPTMPQYDTSLTSYVQVFISDYTMNSAAYTYWKAGRLATVIDNSQLPAGLPLSLNTSSLSIVAPGFASKYPTAVPVQLFATADPLSKPTVVVNGTTEGLIVTMPSLVSFQPVPTPGKPVDGFTVSCPVQASATLSFSGSAVIGNLTSAACTLTEYNSTVGQIDVSDLNLLMGATLNSVILPEINKIANQGIPIPSVDGFKLSNTKLKVHDSYAVIASDFEPTEDAWFSM